MKGPKRTKRLYRVYLYGVTGTVRHFQDKRRAIEWASGRIREGLSAEVHESFLVEWRDEPVWTSSGVVPEADRG